MEGLRAYKPSADFYQQMLSGLGKKPQEVIFVGDSLLKLMFWVRWLVACAASG